MNQSNTQQISASTSVEESNNLEANYHNAQMQLTFKVDLLDEQNMDVNQVLSFIAQSSHNFYLSVAQNINSMNQQSNNPTPAATEVESQIDEKFTLQYDNNFCVIPDEEEKTLIICPFIKNTTIKLSKKRAAVLAAIIQDIIQKW